MTTKQDDRGSSKDELDIAEIISTLWKQKITVLLAALICALISAIYAWGVASPIYESSALLLPTQVSSQDQLGAAAALLGKKSSSSADVDLYQSLLTSRTVLHKLLKVKVKNESDTANGRLEDIATVLKVDMNDAACVEAAIASLASSVVVGAKESGDGGILEMRFSARTPWLAQQIGDSLLSIGQDELRLVRMARAKLILGRLKPAVDQARLEWDSTARTLTYYRDRNRSILLPEQQLDVSRLEMEKSAKEQKYLLVRKEFEVQLLEISKAAPPMMILDAANRPSRKSKPKRMIMIVVGFLLGTIGSTAWVSARSLLAGTFQKNV